MKLLDTKVDSFYIDTHHIAVIYFMLHVSQVQFQGFGNLLGWAKYRKTHSIQHYTDYKWHAYILYAFYTVYGISFHCILVPLDDYETVQ